MLTRTVEVGDMIFVREAEMPGDCRGLTIVDAEKNYNVYVNCDLDDDVKKATLEHELSHVKGGDFCRSGSVDAVEAINSGRCLNDLEAEGEIVYLGFCDIK